MKKVIFFNNDEALQTYECDFVTTGDSIEVIFTNFAPGDFVDSINGSDKLQAFDSYEDGEGNTVEDLVYELTDYEFDSKSIREENETTIITFRIRTVPATEKLLRELKTRVSDLEDSQKDQDDAILELANEVFE